MCLMCWRGGKTGKTKTKNSFQKIQKHELNDLNLFIFFKKKKFEKKDYDRLQIEGKIKKNGVPVLHLESLMAARVRRGIPLPTTPGYFYFALPLSSSSLKTTFYFNFNSSCCFGPSAGLSFSRFRCLFQARTPENLYPNLLTDPI